MSNKTGMMLLRNIIKNTNKNNHHYLFVHNCNRYSNSNSNQCNFSSNSNNRYFCSLQQKQQQQQNSNDNDLSSINKHENEINIVQQSNQKKQSLSSIAKDEIITELIVDNSSVNASIIQGDQVNQTPINPFEYSIKTVEDALHLPGIPRAVALDSMYIAGSIHSHLKQSMDLLQELVDNGRMENAFALFQVMERYYVPVAPECYTAMRRQIEKAMVEVARFNDAIARETERPGSVPDNELYIPTVETMNTVLNYYTETDKLQQAFRVFLAMKILGVQPNQHTYRSLINASLRYEDIDLALLVFENMRKDEIRLEEQTYERLFESCCNSVHKDGAADLYHELVNNFNIPTINKYAYLTTLGITGFMSWLGVPKSNRSGRGWVTSLQISPSRYILPPKHENHKLLEPFLPKEIQNKLLGRSYAIDSPPSKETDNNDNRPLHLRLHERPITHIQFNREGDLLFVAAKDKTVSLWYTSNGERLGTYLCGGVVYSLDVDQNTKYMVTASADSKLILWDVKTGRQIESISFEVSARWVEFSQGDKQILVVTDQIMGCQATVHVFNFDPENVVNKITPAFTFDPPNIKITQATWSPMNKTILASCEDGFVRIYDVETRKLVHTITDHTKMVTKIVWMKHRIMFLTCSKDGTARLYETKTLKHLKTFDTGRPVNAAAISPLKPHIILGGGQSAESVTTTKVDSTQFKVRFYHIAYGDEIGGLIGHIGPVHSIDFTPNGKTFATGGEEGLVIINHLDNSYFEFDKDLDYGTNSN
ncbi:WD40 repeat-containing protein [Heterostelium album PN500]|uniref:Eukaryotic translation initiation factor 3 subunit I n=1 Tax=Heterostelium pallidum (strain ATCC 26659 / Pp 5 / PN500) TaxID=670386 RepID=D3BT43_HETP5|nr:WD40 repeat-containing protein [Heterostelium album PN500]EFA75260.1 WD40 repeat-containing protein [Heterostelium album PN500]|eukprot:XP_020427394.1 WD40 repeat-containing protein [Heterostelium album PN500]